MSATVACWRDAASISCSRSVKGLCPSLSAAAARPGSTTRSPATARHQRWLAGQRGKGPERPLGGQAEADLRRTEVATAKLLRTPAGDDLAATHHRHALG